MLGGVAVVGSLAVNAAILYAALDLGVAPGFEPLSWRSVLFLTAFGAVAATAAYLVVRRLSDNPDRTYRLLAGVALVASFVPDVFMLPDEPNSTTNGILVLMLMHVTVAVICVWLFTGDWMRSSRRRKSY